MTRRGLKLTDDDLEYQLELARSRNRGVTGPTRYSLEEIIEKLGGNIKLLSNRYEFRAMAMLTRMVKDQVTEDGLRKAFEENPAAFGHGVPKASHILIRALDKQGKPLPRGELKRVKRLAEDVYERITRRREDFAKLAGELSEDRRTAALGGDLGFLDPSRTGIDPVVVRTACRLRVGEVARPIFGRDGWHVVKVTEIRTVSFDDARSAVLAEFISTRRKDLLKKLLEKTEIKPGPAQI
jgi:hypothetical protein